jgi:cell wall-associated NlpC family hydrolase
MKEILPVILLVMISCGQGSEPEKEIVTDTAIIKSAETSTDTTRSVPPVVIGELHPDTLLAFARTLQGIPYLYASTDPARGFDCSGFITYVFNHFGVTVPRSSVEFTYYGRDLRFEAAQPGDLILFTGTDSTIREVGHMGIVESIRDSTLYFIHSTSGRNGLGVVITPFEKYYRSRFVKTIRVLSEHYFDRD